MLPISSPGEPIARSSKPSPLKSPVAKRATSAPPAKVTGGERLLEGDDPATGILRITRHPFLWGGLIWAVTHFIANGDLASLVLFGGFVVLTIAGPISIDRKRARKLGVRSLRIAADPDGQVVIQR